MGKCLSRTEKLGNNADNIKNVSPTFRDTPGLSVTEANNVMGISGSTSRNQPVTSSPGNTSGKFHGVGEQGDKSVFDKNVRQHSLTVTNAVGVADVASNEAAIRDKRVGEFFNRYRDQESDCILADGVERLCTDLGIAPDDFSILVFAWKFNAKTMCRFTREEFIGGCHALGGANSPESINARLPDLVTEVVGSREQFRDMYRWTYRFGLDLGQRTLPLAMAISLWRLVFSQRPPPVLDRWLMFLEQRPSGSSGITRDTWDMFLPFTEVIGTNLERYDESEAWPSLIDDFVEYESDRKNHNVAANVSDGGDFTRISSE